MESAQPFGESTKPYVVVRAFSALSVGSPLRISTDWSA